MTKKEQFNVRLPPDLLGWLTTHCDVEGRTKTDVVQELLEAKREGRLHLRPPGPDPFPAEAVPAGTSPDHPLLIGFPPEPDALLHNAFPAEASDA